MNRVKSLFAKGVIEAILISLVIGTSGTLLQASAADTWEWTIPTRGAVNAPVSLPGKSDVYTLVLNELYPAPDTSKGEKEFLELYNYGTDDVSLKGWSLLNKNGTRFTIKDETTIAAKGYLLFEKTVSMNNNGDTVRLQDPDGTERDFIEYTKDDFAKNMSLSRFCDVYELLFCSLEGTPPTPGNANKKPGLEVSVDHLDGSYLSGTKITLSSTQEKAMIYYSLDGTNPDPQSQILYKEPLVLEDDMDILFYAVFEGKSSKIGEAHYRVERGLQKMKNYGVRINEVYMGSGSTLDNSSWVELSLNAQKKINISGWMLTSNKQGNCLQKNTCIKFTQNTFLFPKGYKVLSLPVEMMSAREFYLLDTEKNIADEIHFYPIENGRSFARYNGVQKILTPPIVPSLYSMTDFPTRGKENIIAHTYAEDKDGDMLSKTDEEYYGTLTSRFDTNKNGLPDFYDKGKELENGFQKYFYRKLLADLTSAKEAGGMVYGRTLPSATAAFYTLEEEKIAEIKSDTFGNFSWDPDGVENVQIFIKVTDINNVESFATDPILLGARGVSQSIAGGLYSLRISSLLPNPEGTDTKVSEWIEIHNTGSESVSLRGLVISMNDKDSILKNDIVLDGGQKKQLSGELIAKTIPNSGTVQLKTADGTVIASLEYTDPGAGQVIAAEALPAENVLQSIAVKQPAKTAAKTSAVKVAASKAESLSNIVNFPSLADIAIEEVPAYAADYGAPVVPQGNVVASEAFQNTHPAENEKNIVLALLGGFISTMSGFIFWKF